MRARTMPTSTFPMLSSMVKMTIMKVFDTLMSYPTIRDWNTFIEHPLHGCHK
jgi:aryl carrier-like protein